jgi:hypothetical protein
MKEKKDDYCEDLEFCLKEKKSFIMKINYFFNCNFLSLVYLFQKKIFVFSCQVLFFYQLYKIRLNMNKKQQQ